MGTKGIGSHTTVSQAADDLKQKMKATEDTQRVYAQALQDYHNAEGRLVAASEAEADAHEILQAELAARRRVRRAL